MRTGRPAKPTELKILEGTYQASRDAGSLRLPVSRPKCPAHIDGEARKEWNRIVRELEAIGMLNVVDRAALAAYCDCYAIWVKASGVIAEHGLTFMTESGYEQQRPEVGIRAKALEQMKGFLTEFGMTPASRTRIRQTYLPPKTGTDKVPKAQRYRFGRNGTTG